MSDPDWPTLFRKMQEQLGMLQAEFIQLKDISVSKASLHDTLQLALIAQSQHLSTVTQTAVQEARVQAERAQVAEGLSAPPPPPSPRSRTDKDPQLPNYDGNSDATEFFEQCAENFSGQEYFPFGPAKLWTQSRACPGAWRRRGHRQVGSRMERAPRGAEGDSPVKQ